MADPSAAEPADPGPRVQNLCQDLGPDQPGPVCVSCLGDKSCPKSPQSPLKPDPDGPKQNGTAEAPDPKPAEEIKTQEDPKSPEEDQRGSEPEEKEEEPPLGPDDVVCDSCIESPCRALKSCLTCLVSYCEAHLRPHLENPKFQNHRLLDPLRDIERRTCETHKWPLEVFCCSDVTCVCRDCVTEDHRDHDTVPVQEARTWIEKELKEKQVEVLKTVTAAENAIDKLQTNTVSIQQSVTEVREVIDAQFQELQAVLEGAKKEVTEILEGEEQQALKQAEGIRVHLEQRCTELKKTQVQMEKVSRNKNDVDFLQEYAEWKKEATDNSLPGIYIGLMDRLNSFSRVIVESTKELCETLVTSYVEKVKETCKNDKTGIKITAYTTSADGHNKPAPEPKTRGDFLKYAAQVSFDPDTAHKFLRLTEDNRKVTNTTPWQHPYPDVPERFESCRQVLAAESFYLNRHYFEADVSGDGAHVGLTYKSIDRKGSGGHSCITGNDFSWCLQWNGRAFSAWHSGVETPLNVDRITRIGVYVDYARGLIAFYSVDKTMTLIHKYETEFREPLYPAVWLPKKENLVVLVAPGDPLPVKSPSPPTTPADGAVVVPT
ncbi:tripartite motif-containing protein 16 [Austrofundulus limnaeus]|uniref:Tripartite motif-containing protein 16 n=1 Tax=Austrofundulus limnaeus TaxID=52670 RepID=A0A2I4BRF6_AUSLI|nr:PREDICTED: tripartite motif-containing protein 16-like protein [Austrofundulus limnaeus]